MLQTLSKISVYLIIIVLAFFLKSIGLVKKEDSAFLGKLIINVSLPAALLVSWNSVSFSGTTLVLSAVAILANSFGLFAGYKLSPKRDPETSATMLCVSTYNLGTFLLPFIQLFFPGAGVAFMISFDFGNAIMGLGINYVTAKYFSSPDEKLSIKMVFKGLLRSTPLMTYIVLTILQVLHLQLPEYIYEVGSVIAGGNAFLSMFLVGLLVEFHLSREIMHKILTVTFTRIGLNALYIVCVWFLPIDLLARVVTILCLSGPVATASVVFSQDCGYKGDLVGMVSTLSILIAIPVIVTILMIFG